MVVIGEEEGEEVVMVVVGVVIVEAVVARVLLPRVVFGEGWMFS